MNLPDKPPVTYFRCLVCHRNYLTKNALTLHKTREGCALKYPYVVRTPSPASRSIPSPDPWISSEPVTVSIEPFPASRVTVPESTDSSATSNDNVLDLDNPIPEIQRNVNNLANEAEQSLNWLFLGDRVSNVETAIAATDAVAEAEAAYAEIARTIEEIQNHYNALEDPVLPIVSSVSDDMEDDDLRDMTWLVDHLDVIIGAEDESISRPTLATVALETDPFLGISLPQTTRKSEGAAASSRVRPINRRKFKNKSATVSTESCSDCGKDDVEVVGVVVVAEEGTHLAEISCSTEEVIERASPFQVQQRAEKRKHTEDDDDIEILKVVRGTREVSKD